MPKPDSLQGSLDLLVLKILSRRPGLHGYALMSAIQDISGEVLRAEFPSLAARLRLHIPNEVDKRHGQAIAAASLPALTKAQTNLSTLSS